MKPSIGRGGSTAPPWPMAGSTPPRLPHHDLVVAHLTLQLAADQSAFRVLAGVAPGEKPRYLLSVAGLYSTTQDYLRFAEMLANRRVLDGVRVLSSISVGLVTMNLAALAQQNGRVRRDGQRGDRPLDGAHRAHRTATPSRSSTSGRATTRSCHMSTYIHGGRMQMNSCYQSNYKTWGRMGAAHGLAVAMVDFRNSVHSESDEDAAPFPAGLNDCVSDLKWVHVNAVSLGVDPARIVIAG